MANRYQFGIATLLAITALHAIVLGLLISLGFGGEPGTLAAGVVLVTLVLIGRVFWFGGRRPRTASALTGGLLGIPVGIWHVLALVDYRPPAWGKPYPQSGYFAIYSWSFDDVATEVLLVVAFGSLVGLVIAMYVEGFCRVAGLIGKGAGVVRSEADEPQAEGWRRLARGLASGAGPRPAVPASPAPARPVRNRALRRGPALIACLGLAVLTMGILFRRSVQVAYYRRGLESAAAKMNCRFMPLAHGLADLFGWTADYNERRDECRNMLVELGYLEHREFVLEHVAAPTPESQVLWFHVTSRFADRAGGDYTMDHPHAPQPARLCVWDRPDRIPRWEAFVAQHDVPDFDERFVQGFDPGKDLKVRGGQ